MRDGRFREQSGHARKRRLSPFDPNGDIRASPEIVLPYWFQRLSRQSFQPVRFDVLSLGQAHAAGACHTGAPGGPFINIKFHGSPFANCARGKPLPARRVGVPGTGNASDMKKAVLALATAATIG